MKISVLGAIFMTVLFSTSFNLHAITVQKEIEFLEALDQVEATSVDGLDAAEAELNEAVDENQ